MEKIQFLYTLNVGKPSFQKEVCFSSHCLKKISYNANPDTFITVTYLDIDLPEANFILQYGKKKKMCLAPNMSRVRAEKVVKFSEMPMM